MKDLIRQILREETSGLTDAQIKASYSLMNMITKDYYWYHDTPELRFKFTPGDSIWLINPKTEEWMLELEKSGKLWYYSKTLDTFSMYLNMGESDFQSFIKIWVEDVLKREVVSTENDSDTLAAEVVDVLERGVVSTMAHPRRADDSVEDVLENGKQVK